MPGPQPEPPRLLTLAEAAAYLSEGEDTTRKLYRVRGWVPVGRHRKALLFSEHDVARSAKWYLGDTHRLVSDPPVLTISKSQAAQLLGIRLETLRRRYRLWGVPYWTTYQSYRKLVRFVPTELRAWASSRRGLKVLARTKRQPPAAPDSPGCSDEPSAEPPPSPPSSQTGSPRLGSPPQPVR